MKTFSLNRSRVALMLSLAALSLPLGSQRNAAQADPPRHAPAYGYRSKRTVVTRRTYRRAPATTRTYRRVVTPRRYVRPRTFTRPYGRPRTTIIRRPYNR